jgi:hypothetical protein
MARRLRFCYFGLLSFVALALGPAPAAAQALREPPPSVDVGVGFTMHSPPDVNMRPLCEELSLYCVGSGRTFPDFGIDVSAATRVTGPLFVVGDVNVWGNNWYVNGTAAGHRTNQVLAGLTGLRFRTRYFKSRHDPSSASVFGQVLVGGQTSIEVPGRRVLQPGGGMDIRLTKLIFRIQLDYSYSPRPGRNLTTSRGFMGIVIDGRPPF